MGHHVRRLGGLWSLAVTLGVILILSSCGGDADAEGREPAETEEAGGTTVEIADFLFEPQEAQVPPGTKVTWVNKDSALHNIQDLSDLNIPVSIELAQNYKFSITYEKPGTYPYVCGLHPYMAGTVKVG